MQNRMTMRTEQSRTNVRRRPDGLAQIQSIALPSLPLGTLRTLRLGVVGVALLVAALIAAPFWLAFGSRHPVQGRAGARAAQGVPFTGRR